MRRDARVRPASADRRCRRPPGRGRAGTAHGAPRLRAVDAVGRDAERPLDGADRAARGLDRPHALRTRDAVTRRGRAATSESDERQRAAAAARRGESGAWSPRQDRLSARRETPMVSSAYGVSCRARAKTCATPHLRRFAPGPRIRPRRFPRSPPPGRWRLGKVCCNDEAGHYTHRTGRKWPPGRWLHNQGARLRSAGSIAGSASASSSAARWPSARSRG